MGIQCVFQDKIPGVDVAPLVEAIRAHGHRDAHHVPNLEDIVERLVALAEPGDLMITLGAGSISSLGERLVSRLRERRR